MTRPRMMMLCAAGLVAATLLSVTMIPTAAQNKTAEKQSDPTAKALAEIAKRKVGKKDWPEWGGWSHKNNTPEGKGIPTSWDINTGKNIKWKLDLGTQTYGNPVVANGKIYVGTNNGKGWIKRYPAKVDLGCLICADEKTGKFLWQHSSEKLPSGRVNDWNEQGICDAPYVEGKRLWYVTSRGEVVCLDTEGFLDGKNNGPFKAEPNENKDEADVIWKFDMMGVFASFQHNMCSCSVTCYGDILLVNTSNGVDAGHINIPSPDAPSFFALNRDSGKLLWSDKSPGTNILHGQWSSPSVTTIKGQPMVFFAGGDGWLYCFDPRGDGKGKSKLLWKFDCNPKATKWILGGRGTRNNLIATPVIYEEHVYVAVGQDPEHGEGQGHVYCINPVKKLDGSDVSPTIAVDKAGKPIPHRRMQAIDKTAGETEKKNPNSAMVWHYDKQDTNGDGMFGFEETMHRSCGTVAIKNDILYIADFSGLVHCLNAKTGKVHWTYDMFAASWGSPLIVEDKVYIGDEDGDVCIFPLTADPMLALKGPAGMRKPAIAEINMANAIYTTPIVANNVLYISNKNTLFAISPGGK